MVHLLHRGAGVQRPALAPQKLRNHLDYVGRLINSPQKYLSEPSTALPGRAPHRTSPTPQLQVFLLFSPAQSEQCRSPPSWAQGRLEPSHLPLHNLFALLFPCPSFSSSSSLSSAEQKELSLPRRAMAACHREAGVPHTELPRTGWLPWGNLAWIGNFMIFQCER